MDPKAYYLLGQALIVVAFMITLAARPGRRVYLWLPPLMLAFGLACVADGLDGWQPVLTVAAILLGTANTALYLAIAAFEGPGTEQGRRA